MKKSPSSILLFDEAEKRGYKPIWKTEYGFFTFSYNGKNIYVYQTKNFGNNQLLTWLTTDKYAARLVLDDHKIPNIPYFFSDKKDQLIRFFDSNHPLIAKPVLGEMARDVKFVANKKDLSSYNRLETIFEKYIKGDEYRVLVLKSEVFAMQKKELDPTEKFSWKKKRMNLTKKQWNKELIGISKKIHSFIPQSLLAIDFIIDTKGKNWVLELNSMPGLWSFENPHVGDPIYLAPIVLDLIIESQIR